MLKMRSTVLTTEESNTLITIVNYLKLTTSLTTNEERYLTEIFQKIFVEGVEISFIEIQQGEEFSRTITFIEGDDWSEYYLVGKLDSDNSYLTSDVIPGGIYVDEAHKTQSIPFLNFGNGITGTLNKVRMQLEYGDGYEQANGNCKNVIDEFYFVLKQNPADV